MRFKATTTWVASLVAAALALPVGTSPARPIDSTTAGADPNCVSVCSSSAGTQGSSGTSADPSPLAGRSPGAVALIARHHAPGRLGTFPDTGVANGFDWAAMAIGAAVAVGLSGIAGASMALRRRRTVAA